MQSAKDWVSADRSRILLRLLRVTRDSLLDSLVWTSLIEVALVLLQAPAQMTLIEDEEMVEAFARHSRRILPKNRSHMAFALGA